MPSIDKFCLRKLDNVGVADAEGDRAYLMECWVETGALQALQDCDNPSRLILGRTGVGKTALIEKLMQDEERVIPVRPESLALSHISNSNILAFVSALGVKLDIFFRMLWRHVFAVELLRAHFNIRNEAEKVSLIERLKNSFRDKRHSQALEYLEAWGKTFWQDTDYRIKETTTTLEAELKDSIGVKLPGFADFSAEAAGKLTQEERSEVAERAQYVVNQVQIRQLSDIVDMLQEVLKDPQKRYYIVVDRLDENWIEDRLRYLLIRALIETVRDFVKVRHAKIVIAIRLDLLDRVFAITRDAGFQEEKYESLYLPISWNRQQLIEVIDNRIDRLVKQRYTKAHVTYKDLLPNSVARQAAIEYMLDRTLLRPRDIIQFFNHCLALADGSPKINASMLKQAEGEYSRSRLRAMADEWYADYPNLLAFSQILSRRRSSFTLKEIAESEIAEFCLNRVIEGFGTGDVLSASAGQVVDCVISPNDFLRTLIAVFYRTGLVGVKVQSTEPVMFISQGHRKIAPFELQEDTKIVIHQFAWRALGVQ